jgi:hypothetical protein
MAKTSLAPKIEYRVERSQPPESHTVVKALMPVEDSSGTRYLYADERLRWDATDAEIAGAKDRLRRRATLLAAEVLRLHD